MKRGKYRWRNFGKKYHREELKANTRADDYKKKIIIK